MCIASVEVREKTNFSQIFNRGAVFMTSLLRSEAVSAAVMELSGFLSCCRALAVAHQLTGVCWSVVQCGRLCSRQHVFVKLKDAAESLLTHKTSLHIQTGQSCSSPSHLHVTDECGLCLIQTRSAQRTGHRGGGGTTVMPSDVRNTGVMRPINSSQDEKPKVSKY